MRILLFVNKFGKPNDLVAYLTDILLAYPTENPYPTKEFDT